MRRRLLAGLCLLSLLLAAATAVLWVLSHGNGGVRRTMLWRPGTASRHTYFLLFDEGRMTAGRYSVAPRPVRLPPDELHATLRRRLESLQPPPGEASFTVRGRAVIREVLLQRAQAIDQYRRQYITDVTKAAHPGAPVSWQEAHAPGGFRRGLVKANPARAGQARLGFALQNAQDPAGRAVVSTTPLALWVVAFASPPAAWLWAACKRRRRRRQRLRLHLCVRCGYDLRASAGHCPECGEAIPAAGVAAATRAFFV